MLGLLLHNVRFTLGKAAELEEEAAGRGTLVAINMATYQNGQNGLCANTLDGNDNGVNQYESDKPPRYAVNTALPARVAALNPAWSDPSTDEVLMAGFLKAVELTGALCACVWRGQAR